MTFRTDLQRYVGGDKKSGKNSMTLTAKGLAPLTRIDFTEVLPQVDVRSFATGGIGTLASPWTGWDTGITWASDTIYRFRRGYYSYATWPSSINALHRVSWIGEGMGHTFLKYTGTANAVNYASSVLLPTCQFRMEDFSVHGNASAKKGVVLQDAHHSILRNINVRGFSEHGFLFKGCVLGNYYDIRCSRQSEAAAGWTPIPAVGIEVSNNGGQLSSVNVFYNPIVEFVETCFLIFSAWNTTIIGGSMEGLGGADPDSPLYGFFIGAGADTTTIIGGDHEGCTIANLRIQGGATRTVCINTYFPGGLVDIVDANHTKFIGGLLDDVTVGASGGIVELDCEITGTLTDSGPATGRYRSRILTAQPADSAARDVALQLYNNNGGNLWRVRQTAASDLLRFSKESLAGAFTDYMAFNPVRDWMELLASFGTPAMFFDTTGPVTAGGATGMRLPSAGANGTDWIFSTTLNGTTWTARLTLNTTSGLATFANDVTIGDDLIVTDDAAVGGDLTAATLAVGTGTVLTKIVKGTVTIDPASINATTVSIQTFTLTGAAVGDSLILNPPAAGLNAGIVVGQCYVSATNTIAIVIHNTTAAPIDIASANWNYTLIRS